MQPKYHEKDILVNKDGKQFTVIGTPFDYRLHGNVGAYALREISADMYGSPIVVLNADDVERYYHLK